MAEKFLKLGTNGFPAEQEALVSSAGAADAGKIVALDSSGRLDNSVLPVGVGPDAFTATAGENLAAGDLVYIDTSGEARKADASTVSKMAIGFVLSAVTSGNPATVYFDGTNTGLSSLTVGSRYFLSATTPGAITTTPPATAGHIVQFVGIATSATTLSFTRGTPIVRG